MRNLAEEYLLIAWDDTSGRPRIDGTNLDGALAGALLVELVLGGHLALEEPQGRQRVGTLRRVPGSKCDDPLLAKARDLADGQRPQKAVLRIAGFMTWTNAMRGIKGALFERLAQDGILERGQAKVLGLVPLTTWTPVDTDVEAEIRRRLDAAILHGETPDPRTAALIGLLSASALLERSYPRERRAQVRRRAKEIAAGDWATQAVREAVDSVTSALIAASAASAVVVAGS